MEKVVEKLELISRLNVNMDELYDELTVINVIVERLKEGEDWKSKDTATRWMAVFQTSDQTRLLNMLSVLSYTLSVPASTGYAERIFSITQNKWTNTRNRCSIELIKSELLVTLNFEQSCDDFLTTIEKDKRLLAAARSNTKYSWKKQETWEWPISIVYFPDSLKICMMLLFNG